MEWLYKSILDETSYNGPALVVHNQVPYLGWVGTDGRLNVLNLISKEKWTAAETAREGLALSSWEGKLYIAWTDKEGRLNFMIDLDPQTKKTLQDTSYCAPALAAGPSGLQMAWSGTDSGRYLNTLDISGPPSKKVYSEMSDAGPALCGCTNRLCMAWTGRDSDRSLNIMLNLNTDNPTKRTLQENSIAAPALAINDQTGFLSWIGTDAGNHLNILEFDRSGEPRRKGSFSEESSIYAPALLLGEFRRLEGPTHEPAPNLMVAWTGTDTRLKIGIPGIG